MTFQALRARIRLMDDNVRYLLKAEMSATNSKFPAFRALTVAMMLLFTLSGAVSALAQRTKSSQRAGEQVKAEKGLRDNKYYFYFINPSVSNFGTDREKKIFREAIQRDIIAQILYMRFFFKESYSEIRKAQNLLIENYRSVLIRDVDMARKTLNDLAPLVYRTNNTEASRYMQLGYRDLKVATTYLGMGDNFRDKMYSLRLYKYVEAIKTAKHGIRYGVLAYLNTRERSLDDNYRFVFSAYRSAILAFQTAIESQDERTMMFNSIKRKLEYTALPADLNTYMLLHYDSYFMVKQGKSYYETIWDRPELDEIEDFREYKKSIE